MKNKDVFIALDFDDISEANDFVDMFYDNGIFPAFKIGAQLFYSSLFKYDLISQNSMRFSKNGKDSNVNDIMIKSKLQLLIDKIHDNSYLFLDLNIHDTPTASFEMYKGLLDNFNFDILSVHSWIGVTSLEEMSRYSSTSSIAVVANLSTDGVDFFDDYSGDFRMEYIIDAKIPYVVCQAYSAKKIKEYGVKTICAGIRWNKKDHDDHMFLLTPEEAKKEEVDYIVVGKLITQSKDPIKAYLQICAEFL